MSSGQGTHLSEEALHDVLIGMGTAAAEAHVAACAECREQMETFRTGMENFNAATLAWSQARPMRRPIVTRTRARIAMAGAGWALAAALLFAVCLTTWKRYQSQNQTAEQPAVTQSAPQAEDTETQIAQDNELMRSVDAALSASDSPIAEYHLRVGAATKRGRN